MIHIEQNVKSEIEFFKNHIEPEYDEEYTNRVLELLGYSSLSKNLIGGIRYGRKMFSNEI